MSIADGRERAAMAHADFLTFSCKASSSAPRRRGAWRQCWLALAFGLVAMPGLADDDCDVPVHRWQSREAVRQMAVQRGWQIRRLKIDDGCYEIRGTDEQGRAFKAKINPQTLAIVKIKRRDRDRDHDRERRHDRDPSASPTDAPHPGGAGSPSPEVTPTAPRDAGTP
jgi:hypothetical protein